MYCIGFCYLSELREIIERLNTTFVESFVPTILDHLVRITYYS